MDSVWISLTNWALGLPWWGQLLVFAISGYVLLRTFEKTVLRPLANEGRDLLRSIGRVLQWLEDRFKPKPEPLPPPPVNPDRVIPVETTIWETEPVSVRSRPKTNSIPIIVVANMKGGVGKTTISANLAAEFQAHYKKPVLLIDFDYQGSLSNCVLGEAGITDMELSSDVLLGSTSQDPILYKRQMRRLIEDIYIYPAHYPLATIENNILARWTAAKNFDDMYFLCRQLQRDEFQDRFAAVIIDCPPRLTVGSINGLCAGTHLLVPTTLDDMSAQAAEYFLDQIVRLNNSGLTAIRVVGIVPNIVSSKTTYQNQEKQALKRLSDYGKANWKRDDFVLTAGQIVRSASIAKYAGNGVAYVHTSSAEEIFKKLGNEVRRRL